MPGNIDSVYIQELIFQSETWGYTKVHKVTQREIRMEIISLRTPNKCI